MDRTCETTDMDRLIEVVARAIDEANENPRMIPCPRCEGRGYHHGFGEDGHDPDWCELCGGAQTMQDPKQVPIAAILAVLKGIREPTPEMRGSGELEFLKRRRSASHLAVPAIYASMIDALVKEFAPEGKGE